jgi:hypothetical protein
LRFGDLSDGESDASVDVVVEDDAGVDVAHKLVRWV